jgi:outer membrane receptor for ferrienterochelin and colicin
MPRHWQLKTRLGLKEGSDGLRNQLGIFVLGVIVVLAPLAAYANPTTPFGLPEGSSDQVLGELRFLQEETVSIAVLHEQPISEAPSNVYVITDDDIRHSGANDLPTVLRRIPGMEVIQMTGADFNVSVRGDNQPRANKLLVLVDGRSIYLDMQGEVFWKAIPVTLPEIKRIEVLKGPASALYGFNAFDGIINIITKSPKEMEGVTLQIGGGEFGTFTSSAIYAGTQDKFGYRLSLARDQTNQWESRNTLAFRSHKFNGQFNYALSDQAELNVSGGFLDSNGFDGPVVDAVEITQEPSIGYATVGYKRPNFFIRAWWTRYTQPSMATVNSLISNVLTLLDKSGTTSINSIKANSTNVDIQHALEFGDFNRLTYGLNYRHNQVSSNFLDGDGHEDRLGLYIQDEWKPTSSLTAVAGLRFDMDTFINPTYSPRVSLVYRFKRDHTIRAGFAIAYRSPTIFESRTFSRGLFLAPPLVAGTRTTLNGSDQLIPEEIISYEIGYQGWHFKHRLRTRIDLFFNHISDLIGRGLVTGSTTAFTFFNGASSGSSGGAADIYGFETGIEFLATPWLTGFANYSFQEIGQSYGSANRVQRGGPRFKFNGGLRSEFENGFSGEAVLHYVGSASYSIDPSFTSLSMGIFPGSTPPSTEVGSYVLLNLRGGYQFWKVNGKDQAEVALAVFNALNDRHKEHPLGEILGSRVMGWFTLQFESFNVPNVLF